MSRAKEDGEGNRQQKGPDQGTEPVSVEGDKDILPRQRPCLTEERHDRLVLDGGGTADIPRTGEPATSHCRPQLPPFYAPYILS
jgi:hypothetical protein